MKHVDSSPSYIGAAVRVKTFEVFKEGTACRCARVIYAGDVLRQRVSVPNCGQKLDPTLFDSRDRNVAWQMEFSAKLLACEMLAEVRRMAN